MFIIKNVDAFARTLEEHGLVPVDQFIDVNTEQRLELCEHSQPDANDEVIEQCNVVGSMHVINVRTYKGR